MAHQTYLLVLLLLACLISSTYAYQFNVGGRAGWVPNPPENYNNWAERMRFQVNDTLVFKYRNGSNSVLFVNKDDYDKCNTDNPIMKMDDGNSVFKFVRSGAFFFISGNKDDCGKGQKLIVVVLAVRPIPPFTPTPTASPANPPGINSPSSSPSPSPGGSPASPTPSPSPGGSPASPTPSPEASSASPTSSPPAPAETSPSTGGSSASPPGSSGESPPGSVSPAAGGGNTPADVNTPNGSQSNHKISAAVLVGIVSAIALGGFIASP